MFNKNELVNTFNPDKPYNDLPGLPPLVEIESKDILKQCINAHKVLAELKLCSELVPNPNILINTIPLLEAKASSEIENIITTTDRLFQFADEDSKADSATKEALRYRTALRTGYEAIQEKPLSLSTAMHICSTIKSVDMNVRCTPGTALKNERTGKTIYTPPEGADLLHSKLSDWERFIHSTDIDPLVRLAVQHYQFEAIHPFTDGNGRTGRVLNILFLIQEGLLDVPVLYLSRYIIENRKKYYSLLLKVTSNNEWEEWILFMLKAIEDTARWTIKKIRAIESLMRHTTEHVHKHFATLAADRIVSLIFALPYCRISNVIESGIAKRQTASVHLQKMCNLGVLEEVVIGREKIFIHTKLLSLLRTEKNSFDLYE